MPADLWCSDPWRLLQTKPSQEHRAADQLKTWSPEVYLPVLDRKRAEGTPFERWEPLFPGYIFARVPDEQANKLRDTAGVLRAVRFGAEMAQVAQAIIDAIRTYQNPAGHIIPVFSAGDRVKVVTGAMKGLQGVFMAHISGTERVKVLLDMMNTVLPAEMDIRALDIA